MALERTAQAESVRWWLPRTCVLAVCLVMGGVIGAEAQTPRILPESVYRWLNGRMQVAP